MNTAFRSLPTATKPPSRIRMISPIYWPTPVPKMVSARPVTFWLARRVMVRKLKIREAMPPAMKAHSRPMSTARKALGDSTAFS